MMGRWECVDSSPRRGREGRGEAGWSEGLSHRPGCVGSKRTGMQGRTGREGQSQCCGGRSVQSHAWEWRPGVLSRWNDRLQSPRQRRV